MNPLIKLKQTIRVLLRPKNVAILEALADDEINVTDIMISVRRYDQPEISQGLAELRKFNIVTSERRGKNVYYRKNHDYIAFLGMLGQMNMRQGEIEPGGRVSGNLIDRVAFSEDAKPQP